MYVSPSTILTVLIMFVAGVFSALRRVTWKEGVAGLYRGNGVQMVRIFPYGATQFMAYEQYKKVWKSLLFFF